MDRLVAWMEELPMPALYEVLLNIEPKNLNTVCRSSLRASRICASKRFQEDYPHTFRQSLLQGDLEHTYDIRNRHSRDSRILQDEVGNQVHVHISDWRDNVEKIVYIPVEQPESDQHPRSKMLIMLEKHNNLWKIYIGRMTIDADGSEHKHFNPNELVAFVRQLHRPHWYPGRSGRFKNKNREREVAADIIQQIEPKVRKAFPRLNFNYYHG